MGKKFHINWHYGEPGRNRINRQDTVELRLNDAGVEFARKDSSFGGAVYTVTEIPKNIKRLVTELIPLED